MAQRSFWTRNFPGVFGHEEESFAWKDHANACDRRICFLGNETTASRTDVSICGSFSKEVLAEVSMPHSPDGMSFE